MIIAFSRAVGPVPVSCILTEKHESRIDITEIPIETGAKITDHAYIMPKKVTLDIADANAAATFNALVRFQESRVPFALVTGLSVYQNMLIKSLDADRDATYSRVLRCKADLQEAIIVSTATAPSSNNSAGSTGSAGGMSSGKPGGAKSTKAATPTKASAGNAATANRASSTVTRGEAGAATASPREQTFLMQMFGP